MKRLALLILGLALPACAQRAGSHGGGSSSHSPAPMHSGGFTSPAFTPSSPRITPAPRYTGTIAPHPATPYNNAHPPYGYNNNRNRWDYAWRYRNGVPYLSAVWIGPGLGGGYDTPYDTPYDNSYDTSDDTAGYAPQPPAGQQYFAPSPDQYPDQPPPRQYPPPQPWPQTHATTSPDIPAADSVTLIFKDGRPTEQIHNYIMTRTTLYISDEHRREIPLDQLDLPATRKINRSAGVDFSVPGLTQ